MKKSIYTIMMLFVILTGFLSISIVSAQPATKIPVIVGFKEKQNPDLIVAHGGSIKYNYKIISAIATSLPLQAIEALKRNPNVLYVETDHQVYATQTELERSWGVNRIDADEVHDSITGSGIQVAVLDTGIDYTHSDLINNVVLIDNVVSGYDFVNNDNDPLDDNGHGTHCAGIIAAEANDFGVVGVAPEAGLYAVKVLDSRGSGYTSDIIAGIQWATLGPNGVEGDSDDAEVISMSLGAIYTSPSEDPFKDACDFAYSSGTLVVAASGNDGINTENFYPAAYSSVIAVGATDINDGIASFSNYGNYLELVAPGVSVFSTMPTYAVTMTSTGPPPFRYNNNYDFMSGTSMACPHVAGTAALVFAAGVSDSNEDGNLADNVRTQLQSAEYLVQHSEIYQGYGLVDAEAAVAVTSVGDPTVSWVTPMDEATQISGTEPIKIFASDTDDETGTLTVQWQVDDGTLGTADYNSETGNYETEWDSTLVDDGTHTLYAIATDSDLNTATSSITVTTENIDHPPAVTWVTPQNGDPVQDTVNIHIEASDDRDTTLTVHWQVDDGTLGTADYNSETGNYETEWDSTLVDDGTHTLYAIATDSDLNTATSSITVTVSNEASEVGGMYVWDISWSEKGPHLTSTVTIRYDSNNDKKADSSDAVVSGATVSYTLTSQDGSSYSYIGTTDSSGQIAVMWKRAPSGPYTGEVTSITHSIYTWDSSLDYDNKDIYP